MKEYGFNTTLLHGSEDSNPHGATQVPIYQSSAFRHDTAEELEKIFANKCAGYSYTRINNPTIESFEKRMTKLEGGVGSVACSSGMAALTMALMNILRNGDHVVAAAGLYGGTVELLDELKAYGITTTYVKENTPDAFEKAIMPETRAVFAETIGNPKLDVTDIEGVAEIAHKHGLPFLVDNTVATPYLIQPLRLGADVVIHSSSKYINGSSDAISGVLVSGGKFKWDPEKYPAMAEFRKFGPFAYLAKLRNGLFRSMGACLAPQNAFLNNLGLETLGLRMQRHCSNAMELAEYLTGEHDYKSFCSNPQMKKSTVRIVDSIEIVRRKDLLYFNYHGTGFLQNMVRILTGTLLEVGQGKRTPESVKAALEAKDRTQAGCTAPPQGLCLMRVDY